MGYKLKSDEFGEGEIAFQWQYCHHRTNCVFKTVSDLSLFLSFRFSSGSISAIVNGKVTEDKK